ncbi:hypothetical protein MIM_c38500 [Advenella mimigardefordensis DPN7]|uniref:Uncharacterized protein n=1 Tax=Advenella mimigardefordensis (strain DSM 17166 / LMG 22922 / DPN7) TaxID=1247726 RepID=W0PHB1_ADVMD|nr:hypothetical protein MIM_c38500 [Advenella mimigardefordensis DPN7]
MLHCLDQASQRSCVNPDQATVAAPSFIAAPLSSPSTPVVREGPSSTICMVLQGKQFSLNAQCQDMTRRDAPCLFVSY